MKYLFLFNLVLLSCFGHAQQDGFIRDFGKKWANAMAYTLEVAELMPENHYDFKPTPEEMTFKEQLLHMMGNVSWLSTAYLNGQKSNTDFKKKEYTKLQVIEIIREEFRLSTLAVAQLPAAALEEEVKFFAGPMNKRQIVALLNDHMTHHRGQLLVYLRLQEIKPPQYRGW
ncbi:MAG: DinB family protein [Haliscomenobacter sp.]|nr:DinB family protein [Haliscomenobacter sp.]MBK7477693.1 DinB family protein [Haliscomenobacter sp.]